MSNVIYTTDQIARFYSLNRVHWTDLYPSEQWIFEHVAGGTGKYGKVLDVGCAAGGLGLALRERFLVESYAGVDINAPGIEAARSRQREFRIPVQFHCADILHMGPIAEEPFDAVVNLSCADWNVETKAIVNECWRRVAPQGRFIISLRLTDGPGINDCERSYQNICFDGDPQDCERANYVVFNVNEALRMFAELEPRPSFVLGYGYWGPPSKTAVTPYQRLAFCVFAITKAGESASETLSALHFPLSLHIG